MFFFLSLFFVLSFFVVVSYFARECPCNAETNWHKSKSLEQKLMCGANYHVSERTLIWGTVRNRGTMRSNSHQTGGESRDCTNEDNFFFFLVKTQEKWDLTGASMKNWRQLVPIGYNGQVSGEWENTAVSERGIRQVKERHWVAVRLLLI